jgi:hypothetical protein
MRVDTAGPARGVAGRRFITARMAMLSGDCNYCLFGHWQPFAQSSQQAQSHSQSGQFLQQSSLQHAALALLLQQDAASPLSPEVPATVAATRPVANASPPNNFVNIETHFLN